MKIPPFSILGLSAVLAAGILIGCDSKAPTGSGPAPSSTSSGSSNPTGAGTNSPNSSAPTSGKSSNDSTASKSDHSPTSQPAPTDPTLAWVTGPDLARSAVPADLASLPCYKYYGLGSPTQDISITFSNGNSKLSGTVSMHLKKVENGVAKYVVSRSGDLGQKLGNDYIELRKDGIYDVGNSLITLQHPILDLPANPKDGTQWSSDGTSQLGGQSIRQVISFTAKSNQKEKIGGLMQTALLITGKGTETQGGKTSDLTIKLYCVPELGQIKQVFVDKAKGQPAVTMTYEASNQTQKVGASPESGAR